MWYHRGCRGRDSRPAGRGGRTPRPRRGSPTGGGGRCGPMSVSDESDDEKIRRVAMVLERRRCCGAEIVDVPLLARLLRTEGLPVDVMPDALYEELARTHWLDVVIHRMTH